VKLDINITLDCGGSIGVHGEDLTVEDISEVFELFLGSGYVVDSRIEREDDESEEVEVVQGVSPEIEQAFMQGFDEARDSSS
jgi:hypothetical protein